MYTCMCFYDTLCMYVSMHVIKLVYLFIYVIISEYVCV